MVEIKPAPFHCPGCGREHKEEGRFCPLCGRDLKMFLDARQRDPLIGKIIDQRYRVIKPIGRGGMGVVYHVEHVAMGKVMAMKLLNAQVRARPHAVRRFRQEIKVVSRLSHVHTVSVFDCGDAEDGSLYIVMEYLRGLDLEKLLLHEKMIPCERTARIARQVCASLAEAHERGIVHRDIKPANIFLLRDRGEYDFVKVLDFGIAKLTEPGQEKVTEIGLIVGTPFYMAPEQARGGHYLSPATDIYSLGVVMYEMVTGQLPFRGQTVADYIEAHLRFEPRPPSIATTTQVVDPELEAIILRSMHKSPEHRFSSIEAMQLALDGYLDRRAQLKARAQSDSFPPELLSHHPPITNGGQIPPRTTAHFEREKMLSPAPASYDPNTRPLTPSAAPEESHPPQSSEATEMPSVPEESLALTVQEQVQTPPASPPELSLAELETELPTELLANRADWDRVERNWRWRRRIRSIFLMVFLLSTLAAGGYFGWMHRAKILPQYFPKPISTRTFQQEQEPNNSPLEATNIPINQAITGVFNDPVKDHPTDIDWYRVTFPQHTPSILRITLTPPAFINVELGLYRLLKHRQGDKIIHQPQEVISSNNEMRGGVEMIPYYRWEGEPLYILVRELIVPGEKPQKGQYTLRVEQITPSTLQEVEPNDQFQQATPLPHQAVFSGLHNHKGDIDFYLLTPPNPNSRKLRCKLSFMLTAHEPNPAILLQDAQGRAIPVAIRRYTKRMRNPQAKTKQHRFLRQRVREYRFQMTQTAYLRIHANKHHYTHPYTLQYQCR